jgi:hypothetical protein
VPQDQIARAHRQADEALEDAATALKQQERVVRLVNVALGDAGTPELQEARKALKRLRTLTHNTLIRVRSAQVNLLGIPIETNNHTAAWRQSDHSNSRETDQH